MANSQDIGIIDQPNGGNLNNGGHLNKHVDDENKQTDNQVFSDHETVSNFKLKCGWLNFRPEFLQRFLSAKWALFWLCWAAAMQGLLVNGCVNVVITTIERRFGLRSSQTGLVASGYDIASFFCLVPVTYFGGRKCASKPRWLASGIILMGLGSLVFALPHFLVGPYHATGTDNNICNSMGNTSSTDCDSTGSSAASENLTWTVWFFFAAQLLHGAGASPLFTLGVTYIDENVSKKMSSVYLGIFYMMAIVGPAIGYVIGGQLLLVYTDFLTDDPTVMGLTPQSKVWVGAWWVSFLFVAILCVLISIPLFAFPKSLPGAEELQQERVSEAHTSRNANSSESGEQNFTKLKEIPKALFALLSNPTFCLINLASVSENLLISGFAAFLPKFIENQFSVTAVKAALLMGIITVPAGGGGTFFGGYLVKKLKLNCRGIIKFCLVTCFCSGLFIACFLLSCPNISMAGVTQPYRSSNMIVSETQTKPIGFESYKQLENQCNSKCSCNERNYEPICGVDNILYFSPCHAGCAKELAMDNAKVYLDCDCISAPNRTEDRGYDAINTMCENSCNNLWYFIAICFFLMLFVFLGQMPSLSATLRCVEDHQRSFGLGIQWIKIRLLGTIPAPIIFGRLIDETCILWQKSCDDAGNCLVYENKEMSKYMFLLALVCKVAALIFFFIAWKCYIPPKAVAEEENNENNGLTYIEEAIPSNGIARNSNSNSTDRY